MTEGVMGLMVVVDQAEHVVTTEDQLEDVQVLLLCKSQRAGDRGETFDRDYWAYTANACEYQFHAMKQGRLLPPTEI